MKPYRIMRTCDTCFKAGEICPEHRGMCIYCCRAAQRYTVIYLRVNCNCFEEAE